MNSIPVGNIFLLITWLFLVPIFKSGNVDGANILFFYGIVTRSHRIAMEPLAHKLAERGHNITFLSPVRPEKPNPQIHEFVPEKINELYHSTLTGLGDTGFPERLKDKHANWLTHRDALLGEFLEDSCRILLQSPDLKPWLERSKFDLIILAHASNKCAYGFAHKWNASVIVSSANTFFTAEEDVLGAPLESSWLPRFQISNVFTDELTFYDRVYNTLNPILYHLNLIWFNLPRLDGILREYLELPDMPPLEELERLHTSLFFINQHFSEDYARSLPPSVIPIGGMHCTDEHQGLPQDLEEFIQGAGEDGFIFVSFGSMVKMSMVPDALLNVFFEAIKDLKVRFLWRWDKEPPRNLPKNVLTRTWFPQQDLLAHSRIKGFISHGGLMSMQQAIFHAVPLIVIPVVFDQPFNARKARLHGIGIHLELSEITVENFHAAVVSLVTDESLRHRTELASRRFRDRPLSALDTAVYWTEYVLRHRDCPHMKPLAVHQSWWKRRLLDVWLFVYSIVLIAVVLVVKIVLCGVGWVVRAGRAVDKAKRS